MTIIYSTVAYLSPVVISEVAFCIVIYSTVAYLSPVVISEVTFCRTFVPFFQKKKYLHLKVPRPVQVY